MDVDTGRYLLNTGLSTVLRWRELKNDSLCRRPGSASNRYGRRAETRGKRNENIQRSTQFSRMVHGSAIQ